MADDDLQLPMLITNYSFALTRLIGFLATVCVQIVFAILASDPDSVSPLVAAVILGLWSIFIVWSAVVLIRAPWSVFMSEDRIRVRYLLLGRSFTWTDINDLAIGSETIYVHQGILDIPFRRYATLKLSVRGRRVVTVFLSSEEARLLEGKSVPPRSGAGRRILAQSD